MGPSNVAATLEHFPWHLSKHLMDWFLRTWIPILPNNLDTTALLFDLMVALICENPFHCCRCSQEQVLLLLHRSLHTFVSTPKQSSGQIVFNNKWTILTKVPPGMPYSIWRYYRSLPTSQCTILIPFHIVLLLLAHSIQDVSYIRIHCCYHSIKAIFWPCLYPKTLV